MFSNSSSLSGSVDNVFLYVFGITATFLILITFLMIYFVIKYNRKKGCKSEHIEGNFWIELIWIVLPTLLVLSMFYYGWIEFKKLRAVPEGAMNITVLARKWSWLFIYKNGRKSTTLKVPINTPVRLKLTSNDVLHSFYIPSYRVKEDVVPGRENYTWFKALIEGRYDIFCTEYCGEQHSGMLSSVEVLSEEEFEKWFEEEENSTGLDHLKENGCLKCHTVDGSKLVGPSFKGIFGKMERVVTDGVEREILVDEDYIWQSLMEPDADIVVGYPNKMSSFEDLIDDEDIEEIIEYIKSIGKK